MLKLLSYTRLTNTSKIWVLFSFDVLVVLYHFNAFFSSPCADAMTMVGSDHNHEGRLAALRLHVSFFEEAVFEFLNCLANCISK